MFKLKPKFQTLWKAKSWLYNIYKKPFIWKNMNDKNNVVFKKSLIMIVRFISNNKRSVISLILWLWGFINAWNIKNDLYFKAYKQKGTRLSILLNVFEKPKNSFWKNCVRFMHLPISSRCQMWIPIFHLKI